ncbi:GTP-binding protein [Pontibacter sp. G13]|uniref:CobW family GTP-binding protein n=1 Tax=Pontibacter sp. G13 TaxID=3074898 RepID=UPI00288C3DA3|nr:GTP-binding protein [Pontibacter sp. G13]WNJ16410.1 GTP-binding protein [Pontibacter sp. G13]
MEFSPVPVTIITGYLGAGKTTLLNHLLTQPDRRWAVVVNEFGQIGIDNALVLGVEEDLVSLNNGCLCCQIRDDLVGTLMELISRRAEFDGIIVETSGIANPAPILHTLLTHPFLNRSYQLDGVITVVDSIHLDQVLQEEEGRTQIALADVLIANKADLLSAQEMEQIQHRIQSLNADAPVFSAIKGQVDDRVWTQRRSYDIQSAAWEAIGHDSHHHHDHEHDHEHDHSVTSHSFKLDGTISPESFQQWMGRLMAQEDMRIYRMKGILNLEREDHRIVFHGVHQWFDSASGPVWKPEERRTNQFVFIGKDLKPTLLEMAMSSSLTRSGR